MSGDSQASNTKYDFFMYSIQKSKGASDNWLIYKQNRIKALKDWNQRASEVSIC